ncbi:putative RNA helicase [Helianthus annuus]|nr:putative RNA helicase [Helianthus annuus]
MASNNSNKRRRLKQEEESVLTLTEEQPKIKETEAAYETTHFNNNVEFKDDKKIKVEVKQEESDVIKVEVKQEIKVEVKQEEYDDGIKVEVKQEEYEEVHVPALKPDPLSAEEKLVKISAMPHWTRMAFDGLTELNRVQSKVYETALFKSDNILVCAPTGSGKTNVAMLTILQQMGLHRNEDGSFNHSDYKIVYVAPMKALAAEVVRNLSNRLTQYGVTVMELSGDKVLNRQQIEETQIIVATPEKWAEKLDNLTYTRLVKLIIIDAVHLLHDDRRRVLKSIVASTGRQKHIRLVGLSSAIPNSNDVASFLRDDQKKGLFSFDNRYRSCQLAYQCIGIEANNPQLMDDICYEKVIGSAGKHQVLIFVQSKKETTNTARAIKDTALANDTLRMFLKDETSREILREHTELVRNSVLKDLLPYGLAIHNGGMTRDDRESVELLFAKRHIQVLVSTSTLACGVNLPAHTVIIKGTQVYKPEKRGLTEVNPLVVTQMLGCAGRLQYDTYGEGIIITEHNKLEDYLSLIKSIASNRN